jgi:hypothetical protein
MFVVELNHDFVDHHLIRHDIASWL